jgi:hypothetical protein
MSLILAELKSPIPLPEADILLGSPSRWRMGDLDMIVAPFTLHRFRLFDRSIRIMPFLTIDNERVPFHTLMNDSEPEERAKHQILQTIQAWKEERRLRRHIADLLALLIAVSDPAYPDIAASFLLDWGSANGIQFPPNLSRQSPIDLREALYTYAQHKLEFASVGPLLIALRQANIEFKKKVSAIYTLLIPLLPPEPSEKKKLSQTFANQRSAKMQLLQSKPSP